MPGENHDEFRVAIIGGGMGGATAAYFLRKQFGSQCSITLFEQSGRIGGRMKSATFAGRLVETGASIFHSKSQYMNQFANEFGLTVSPSTKPDSRVAFYDGFGKCAFNTFGGPHLSVNLRYIWHFGLDAFKMSRYTNAVMKDFSKIYRLQEDGHCFTTTAHLLSALRPEFVQMTTCQYGTWLTEKVKLGKNLKNELAFGLISNNYCQDFTVHSFVGLFSLSTTIPRLVCVKGGNELVPANLVKHALSSNPPGAPKNFIPAQVQSISPSSANSRYTLEYSESGHKHVNREEFDYVILAAPLHQESTIEGKNNLILPTFQFQRVDQSFFHNDLKEEAFGLKPNSHHPKQELIILPTEQGYLKDINCLYRSFVSPPSETVKRVWAIFSEPQRVSDPIRAFSSQYFRSAAEDETTEKPVLARWYASPVYQTVTNPEKELGQFVLAPRLYYANAIEHAASCMEMAAIGGRNVALLVAADRQKTEEANKKVVGGPKKISVNTFPIPSLEKS